MTAQLDPLPAGALLSSAGWAELAPTDLQAELQAPVLTALAVEDSSDELFVLQRAFRRATRLRLIGGLQSGYELVQYFHGEGPYSDRGRFPLPDLLLLDLKMPGMDGFEVLRWLSQQRPAQRPVVVILSSSSTRSDVAEAMELGADYYQRKPTDPASNERLIQWLELYMVFMRRRREPGPEIPWYGISPAA
jgi:CheY-like chemotaxis protein